MALSLLKFGSKRDLRSEFRCNIKLLNENEVLEGIEFPREAKGQFLLDHCFKYLHLEETDFFGLRFTDSHDQKAWLDPMRPILKQVKGLEPLVFCFRVKFYPADPSRVREELTRYLMFCQLRRDLKQGRLQCNTDDLALLLAWIVQSELGDYDATEHTENYLSALRLLPNQNCKLEEVITRLHQTECKGLTPADAELNFLRKVATLETYGVDPHPVKDQKSNQLNLGINHSGILVFQGNRKINHFTWKDIRKTLYEGRMFIIHLAAGRDKKNLVGYKCSTTAAVQYLWRTAVEHQYFFTMDSSRDVPAVTAGGGLFSKSVKLRYSGRVEKELLEEGGENATGESKKSNILRSYSTISGSSKPPVLGRASTLRRTSRTTNDFTHDASSLERSFCENAYLNYSAFSEPGEGHIGRQLNSTHPPLQHMQAFEEDWDTGKHPLSRPTEFSLRPDHTPDDTPRRSLSDLEKPDAHSSPSLARKKVDTMHNSHSHSNSKQSSSPATSSARESSKITKVSKTTSNQSTLGHQILKIVHVSLVTLVCLFLILAILTVVILESESHLFSNLKKLPEVILFKHEYYEPFKRSMRQKVASALQR